MKIKWLGHSAFAITASDGTTVLTDPYRPGAFDGAIEYGPIRGSFDVVTVSHKHADHDGVEGLAGSPTVLDAPGRKKIKGVEIEGLASFHDKAGGKQRGQNTIFSIKIDGLKVCHLGDLGHIPDEALLSKLGDVDVLLTPVGGTFTLDAAEAWRVVEKIKPQVVIPMHFKTPKVAFDLARVERFTAGKPDVVQAGSSEVEFTRETLPPKRQIIVLEHAL
ncbi:MAG: MBL fold metallo-hydrolase [Candidatus Coatesbacteria bacterium]|nr:MBL fold metallo-hydrolase [Candidatus Coatesbacteria bacterium]